MIIHPSYDAECHEWFVTLPDSTLAKASSLHELTVLLQQRKVGRFKIKDYYPLDKIMPRHVWPEEPRLPVIQKPSPSPREVVHRAPKRPRHKWDHELILDLWAKGHTGPEIGKQLGMPNWRNTAEIISRARRRGDPRAHSRTKNPAWRNDWTTKSNVLETF